MGHSVLHGINMARAEREIDAFLYVPELAGPAAFEEAKLQQCICDQHQVCQALQLL